jgi:hypothetical protein
MTTDRQCPSCGGFCKKSGCERENVREWQGLTEDDALQLLPVMPYEYEIDVEMILEFASAIEQALKEKNHAV